MANNETELVSIVIPCYNGASTVIEAIQSALDQTYKDIEVIVVDDGSTDDSSNIIQKLIASEPKISLYHQKNRGLSAARNYGLSHARGEYVIFLDADDKLKNTYVALATSYYSNHPKTSIVYSNMELFERETGLLPLMPFEIRSFLRQNCIPAFAMVRTEQIKAIGGFDETVMLCEDWECWMHLLKIFGGEVYRIEEPQYFYRKRNTEDSILDRNTSEKKVNEVSVYVFLKHQQLYEENGMTLRDFYLLEDQLNRLSKKYYNVWYKKAFYMLFKQRRYKTLY